MFRQEKLMSKPMRVIKYPNSALCNPTSNLSEWNNNLHLISQGMMTLALLNQCNSLSANQVGYNYRFFVKCFPNLEVVINPEIIEIRDDEYDYMREGCLSFSKILYYINRPTYIKVKYNDIKLNIIEKSLSGLQAKIFCHELDHLNGVLLVDRFSQEEKNEFLRRYK